MQDKFNFADEIYQVFKHRRRTALPHSDVTSTYRELHGVVLEYSRLKQLPFIQFQRNSDRNKMIFLIVELDDCCTRITCKYSYCKLLHSTHRSDLFHLLYPHSLDPHPHSPRKAKLSKLNIPPVRLIQRMKDVMASQSKPQNPSPQLLMPDAIAIHNRMFPQFKSHEPTSYGVWMRFKSTFCVRFDRQNGDVLTYRLPDSTHANPNNHHFNAASAHATNASFNLNLNPNSNSHVNTHVSSSSSASPTPAMSHSQSQSVSPTPWSAAPQGSLIPFQRGRAYLSVSLSPAWTDVSLVRELAEHIRVRSGKHVMDAAVPYRVRLGFFTAKRREVAAKFKRLLSEREVRLWGRVVPASAASLVEIPKHGQHQQVRGGVRVKLTDINGVIGDADFKKWVRQCTDTEAKARRELVCDTHVVFGRVAQGSAECVVMLAHKEDAKAVLAACHKLPFRGVLLRFKHYAHPNVPANQELAMDATPAPLRIALKQPNKPQAQLPQTPQYDAKQLLLGMKRKKKLKLREKERAQQAQQEVTPAASEQAQEQAAQLEAEAAMQTMSVRLVELSEAMVEYQADQSLLQSPRNQVAFAELQREQKLLIQRMNAQQLDFDAMQRRHALKRWHAQLRAAMLHVDDDAVNATTEQDKHWSVLKQATFDLVATGSTQDTSALLVSLLQSAMACDAGSNSSFGRLAQLLGEVVALCDREQPLGAGKKGKAPKAKAKASAQRTVVSEVRALFLRCFSLKDDGLRNVLALVAELYNVGVLRINLVYKGVLNVVLRHTHEREQGEGELEVSETELEALCHLLLRAGAKLFAENKRLFERTLSTLLRRLKRKAAPSASLCALVERVRVSKVELEHAALARSLQQVRRRYLRRLRASPLQSWDAVDVVEWIAALSDKKYAKHRDAMLVKAAAMQPLSMATLSKDELCRLGLTDFKDVCDVHTAVEQLVAAENSKMQVQARDESDKDDEMATEMGKACVFCEGGVQSFACIPCGHLCACQRCKDDIGGACPLCLSSYDSIVRIYA